MIDVDSVTGRFQLLSSHLPVVNEWLRWVDSTRSLTVRPDIGGHRYANGRKATYSRLTDAVTSTSAMADDATNIISSRTAVDRVKQSHECPNGHRDE
jgi:hypothetical protein